MLSFGTVFERATLLRQFARLYPLSQSDLPVERQHVDFTPRLPANVVVENPSRDYTPPSASLP